MKFTAIAGLLALLAATPCQAEALNFRAVLQGDRAPSATGSAARGDAQIRVDTEAQTVDLKVQVRGMRLDELSTALKSTPMGPIHLHLYGQHDHADPNAQVQLVFAAPFGASYRATQEGFRLELTGASYAQTATALRSATTFGDFVQALRGGAVVVNIHTNAWPQGEISGDITPTAT